MGETVTFQFLESGGMVDRGKNPDSNFLIFSESQFEKDSWSSCFPTQNGLLLVTILISQNLKVYWYFTPDLPFSFLPSKTPGRELFENPHPSGKHSEQH